MKKIDKLYLKSPSINIKKSSKIVLMSDCHRGSGNNYDNFLKNKYIYIYALEEYYKKGFTYIELGDGDDMWEVKNYEDIIEEHIDVFKTLKKFHDKNRFIMIYGNHDIVKRKKSIIAKYFSKYYDIEKKQTKNLLPNLKIQESLILNYKNHNIFLIHGHQIDYRNNNCWRISRFIVRHIWRHLEQLATKDPTNAAKNHIVIKKTEKKLKKWSIKNNTILITGHTHRPLLPLTSESMYFNAGSCIHPNGITCIEIEKGNITLVKWSFHLKNKKYLSVRRKVIAGNIPLINYYNY